MLNNHNHQPISHDRIIASLQFFYDTLFFSDCTELSVDDLADLFYNLFQEILVDAPITITKQNDAPGSQNNTSLY